MNGRVKDEQATCDGVCAALVLAQVVSMCRFGSGMHMRGASSQLRGMFAATKDYDERTSTVCRGRWMSQG